MRCHYDDAEGGRGSESLFRPGPSASAYSNVSKRFLNSFLHSQALADICSLEESMSYVHMCERLQTLYS